MTDYENFFDQLLSQLNKEDKKSAQKFYKLHYIFSKYNIDFKPSYIDQFYDDCFDNLFCEIKKNKATHKQWELKILPAGKRYLENIADPNRLMDKLNKELAIKLTEAEKLELSKNIDQALLKLEKLNLSQEKLSQARTFLIAARNLVDAPEPPLGVIKYLLNSVDNIIGISGILVGIAGIIVGLS